MAAVFEWFGLKITRTVFINLASKPVVMVSGGLASKPAVMVFSSLASNPAVMISSGLTSKIAAMVSGGLTSKPAVTVSRFVSQNRQLRFGDLGLKIIASVSWFGPQNHVSFGLLVAPQNRRRKVSVEHASRSSALFHVKASQDKVFQSGLKTDGDTTTGGARGIIMDVASESS
jgi:hypothetical protein